MKTHDARFTPADSSAQPKSAAASFGRSGKTLEDNRNPAIQKKPAGTFLTDNRPVQKKTNNTGLPDGLKNGVESLSGHSLSDVKVHYNSAKPAQLQAHAYAQGNQIHLAPGQEKHLPHEAWHVVQQKQGRVKPTIQMKKGVAVNNNKGLEHEADVMGNKAALSGGNTTGSEHQKLADKTASSNTFQLRHIGMFGLEAEVIGERLKVVSLDAEGMEGLEDTTFPVMKDPLVSLEEYSLGTLSKFIKVTLDNEVKTVDEAGVERSYTVEFIQNPIDVLSSESSLQRGLAAWQSATAFWTHLFNRKDSYDDLSKKMSELHDLEINSKWSGDQFAAHETNENISTEDGPKGKTHSLNWDKLKPAIDIKSTDPKVSPQLTAGASLLALDKAFLATSKPLTKSEAINEHELASLKIKHPENEESLGTQEAIALMKLIGRYIASTRNPLDKAKRYAKEYIILMSRTSLDSIFTNMSAPGKSIFLKASFAYLKQNAGNTMGKVLAVPPDTQIFPQAATKEAQASEITVEQLLLSILKWKKADDGKYSLDRTAAHGDAFSQAELAGISEINKNSPENVTRFGLKGPGEMMYDVKGIIFENRMAATIPLSQMAKLFRDSAHALRLVEDMFEQKRLEQVAVVQSQKLREDAFKAKTQPYSYRY